jgi:hypothetical protein
VRAIGVMGWDEMRRGQKQRNSNKKSSNIWRRVERGRVMSTAMLQGNTTEDPTVKHGIQWTTLRIEIKNRA